MVGFLMGGCSLNIPLEDQFSDPDAITDVLSARSLLASPMRDYLSTCSSIGSVG